MVDNANRTFVSSVLFLDIVEYSKQSVTDQLTLKQRFNDLVVDALKHVAVSDRIVLDTGDGAAISFQGNPEDSLFAAMHLRDALAATEDTMPRLDVRFGINLGPVRLIKDINGQSNIIGDGINAAQRVMSFAEAGTILVSRSYFEVVSRLSDDYAKIFYGAGTRTDKHVREHAVYAIGKPAEPGTRILSTETLVSPPAATTPPVTPPSPVSDNPKNSSGRKFLYAGVAAVVVAAIFGGGMRVGHQGATADSPSNTVPATKAVPAARTIAPKSSPPAAQAIKSPPPVTKLTAPVTTPAPPLAKSPVVLAISPWGEVYVDDIMKGVSPPLKALSLTPGTHTIEVRNPGFPAYVKTIVAKPGVEIRIQHKF